MDTSLYKFALISEVTQLISKKHNISLREATNLFYKSRIAKLLDDDENGFYGDSPIVIFDYFELEYEEKN